VFLIFVYFIFRFCFAKGLAKCKFGGVISLECYAFKPLNLHLLNLSYFCNIIFCRVFVFVSVFRSYGKGALYIMDFLNIC
jgi:hypothetical protein